MKIGIPKALLFYRYGHLWEKFFNILGHDVVLSNDTNKEILQTGIDNSISENCLPAKIYLGHIKDLIDKCDYILVPRFENYGRNEEMCSRFLGIYDIVCNTYNNINILNYNVQVHGGTNEIAGFIHMGKLLGSNRVESIKAYRKAKKIQLISDNQQQRRQLELFIKPQLKILISAQPYLIYDPYIGAPVINIIKQQGAIPIFSDKCDRKQCNKISKEISYNLYWSIHKESVGSILLNRNNVDGVILLSAFPCGIDSLVNELVIRKVKDIPIIQILLDELQGESGLQTRIESFIDILSERRRLNECK